MEFRDLKRQYEDLKGQIDRAVTDVLTESRFIMGRQVKELEEELAQYVGVRHCITCANGTDALELSLAAWEIGPGDVVFVPDFTFFSSGEVVCQRGATPVFVDVEEDTFNISPEALEGAVRKVLEADRLTPRAVIAVDLFGQPADYRRLREITSRYGLLLLEDGAQGFGGTYNTADGERRACGLGDISTTSFFPSKPLGCYGDGGAVFTDDDGLAEVLRSLRVHGKGTDKYDNIRIGRNSRLDTIQAAILKVKLKAFRDYELDAVNRAAERYGRALRDVVVTPSVRTGSLSSWAQYTVVLSCGELRDRVAFFLGEHRVPSMIYYKKPMHMQTAFSGGRQGPGVPCPNSINLCKTVLSLPMHPYLTDEEIDYVAECVRCAKESG